MKRTISPEQHPFYHNTLKLLQNYRDVNWSLEVSAQNLQSEFALNMAAHRRTMLMT